jgi:hypothetical protein
MTGTLPSSFIDTVRALAPQIEASAEEREQTRRLPPVQLRDGRSGILGP